MPEEPAPSPKPKKKRIRPLTAEEFALGLTLHRARLRMTPEEIASCLWGMPVRIYKALEAGKGPDLPPWVKEGVLKTLGRMRPTAG